MSSRNIHRVFTAAGEDRQRLDFAVNTSAFTGSEPAMPSIRCVGLLLVIVALSGCGESTQDRMLRIAKARGVTQAAEDAEEAAAAEKAAAAASSEAAASTTATPSAPPPPSQAAGATTPAAQANSTTTDAAAAPTADEEPLPDHPLTELERKQRTVAKLEKLSSALQQYIKKVGYLPPTAILSGEENTPVLSWRVDLLPYLGYGELHKKFRLDEPWDSQHNKKLLDEMPPIYRSLDDIGSRTKFVALTGPTAAFSHLRGQNPSGFEGKPHNVLMLVEADNDRAVPWTKPQDFPVVAENPATGLGGNWPDGFLAILGDGAVCRVPRDTPVDRLRGLFSIDGGAVPAAILVKAPLPTEEELAAAAKLNLPVDPTADVATSGAADGSGAPATSAAEPVDPLANLILPATTFAAQQAAKEPIPPTDALEHARELLRDVHREEMARARTPEDRVQLAQKLLDDAPSVAKAAADYYESLRIARDLAVAGGGIDAAFSAIDAMDVRFQIDAISLRSQAVYDISINTWAHPAADALQSAALETFRRAVEADNYPAAEQSSGVLINLAKAAGDRRGSAQATQLQTIAASMSTLYKQTPAAIAKLHEDWSDPQANETAGKYFCLLKNRWDIGLPLLAKCGDIRLRGAALVDLDSSKAPPAMLQLAEHYLDMSGHYKAPLDRGLRLRAAHYYAAAASGLTGSLEKKKAEKRLDQARGEFGDKWLNETLGLQDPQTADSD